MKRGKNLDGRSFFKKGSVGIYLLTVFIVSMMLMIFFIYSLSQNKNSSTGSVILTNSEMQFSESGRIFNMEFRKGECIPASSIIEIKGSGVSKKMLLEDFVRITNTKWDKYFGVYFISKYPNIRGNGFCYGILGESLAFPGAPQQMIVTGVGPNFLGETIKIPFDLTNLNINSGQEIQNLEITLSFTNKEIYSTPQISEIRKPSEGVLLSGPRINFLGDDLTITSNFEQGNLIDIKYVDDRTYSAKINMTNLTRAPSQKYQWWFYFKVQNATGKNFVINVTNLLDLDINENRWRNIWPVYSFDNENWSRLNPLALSPTNYFKLYESPGNNSYFTINLTSSQDTLWIAALPPYVPSKSDSLRNNLLKYNTYVTSQIIGYSEDNRPVNMITITDSSYSDVGKKKILIFSGQHSTGESAGNYALEGLMNFLVSSDPLAAQIRRNSIFKIIHIVNIDASTLGIPRFNFRSEDCNREWDNPVPPGPNNDITYMAQEVWAVKQQRITWLPDVLIDLHGSINDDVNYFIYAPSQAQNATHYAKLTNLMNNISKYWSETSQFGRLPQGISGAAVYNSYNENRTLALLIEWAPNCMVGNSSYENAIINNCFNQYIRNTTDWKTDGSKILRGVYEYICTTSACSNSNQIPIITLNQPQNHTDYPTSYLLFNITVNEQVSICKYSLNSQANVTLTQNSNPYIWTRNVTNLNSGQNTAIFYCNDTEGLYGTSGLVIFSTPEINQAPIITLNQPIDDESFVNNQDINFNFTAKDDKSTNLICSIFLDSKINQTNSSTKNNTLTNFLITGISFSDHVWNVSCADENFLTGYSETRPFAVSQIDNPPKYYNPSTNSTVAGQLIKHNLRWQDDIGLSYAIFSFDNCTGSLQNISSQQLSGTSDWSNFTIFVNSTIGCTIEWCVYANDTQNHLNTSCSDPEIYQTTAQKNITITSRLPTNNSETTKSSFPATQEISWKIINFVNETTSCSLYLNNSLIDTKSCTNNTLCSITAINLAQSKYYWEINCSDFNGNQEESLPYYFTLKKKSSGGGGGGGSSYCGDGTCNIDENQSTCCKDCGCAEGICNNETNTCGLSIFCGDGTCNLGENQINCCKDCGCDQNSVCLEDSCQSIETSCGDSICQTGETISNCKEDCLKVYCGNTVCDSSLGENSELCCTDCGCAEGDKCESNQCINIKKTNTIAIIFFSLTILAIIAVIITAIRLKLERKKLRDAYIRSLDSDATDES